MKQFLKDSEYVDFNNESIQAVSQKIFKEVEDDITKVKVAFKFVRDEIAHPFDVNLDCIVASASDVLKVKAGICHAKANLLAALLRGQGFPTGFCYQHITLSDDNSMGYCLHCYNAVYVSDKWIKLDARGNTNGRNAQFSMGDPVLAFPNRPEYDEYFVPGIFAQPHMETMKMLEKSNTTQDVLENIPEFREDTPDISED